MSCRGGTISVDSEEEEEEAGKKPSGAQTVDGAPAPQLPPVEGAICLDSDEEQHVTSTPTKEALAGSRLSRRRRRPSCPAEVPTPKRLQDSPPARSSQQGQPFGGEAVCVDSDAENTDTHQPSTRQAPPTAEQPAIPAKARPAAVTLGSAQQPPVLAKARPAAVMSSMAQQPTTPAKARPAAVISSMAQQHTAPAKARPAAVTSSMAQQSEALADCSPPQTLVVTPNTAHKPVKWESEKLAQLTAQLQKLEAWIGEQEQELKKARTPEAQAPPPPPTAQPEETAEDRPPESGHRPPEVARSKRRPERREAPHAGSKDREREERRAKRRAARAQATAEAERHIEREKRKALFKRADSKNPAREVGSAVNGRLTANGWERSEFSSAREKNKFLRLMGGQKFASAEAAGEASSPSEFEVPADCPSFELAGGEWVESNGTLEPEKGAAADTACGLDRIPSSEGREREHELERQFMQCRRYRLRQGLGADQRRWH